MVRLPKLPDPDKAFSIIDRASGIIDKGLGFIDKIETKLDQLGITEGKPPQTVTSPSTRKVTDQETLIYQFDHLLIPLRQLELHLAEECKVLGIPCDCCQKSAMDIRVFAQETISIAARSGKQTAIFSEIADWAGRIEEIASEANSASGKYSETYRAESGNASRYRKQIQALLSEVKAGG